MKKLFKTVAYLAAFGLTIFFAFRFFQARAQPASGSPTTSLVWLVLCILSLIATATLVGLDLRKVIKSRAEAWMLEAGGSTDPVPELEEAQKVRAAGDPLDAIRMLREYLQANPYEIHVMGRIAEIYRYDLKNDLAAALEYEEMLKRKLPDDQWAWAALHLAKLYGRLNDLDKSVTLLERLDQKYGHTIAGRRAKKALEQARNPDAAASLEDDAEPDGGPA
jgi:tetratricopeptide (TPR) repeat protein